MSFGDMEEVWAADEAWLILFTRPDVESETLSLFEMLSTLRVDSKKLASMASGEAPVAGGKEEAPRLKYGIMDVSKLSERSLEQFEKSNVPYKFGAPVRRSRSPAKCTHPASDPHCCPFLRRHSRCTTPSTKFLWRAQLSSGFSIRRPRKSKCRCPTRWMCLPPRNT